MEERLRYGPVRLLQIESDAPYAWQKQDATHMRVSLPSSYENTKEMLGRGFFFADRTLDTRIVPAKSKLDYARYVRTKPELVPGCKEEILQVARESFTVDRRFHLAPAYDAALAAQVLQVWVEELENCFVCRVREELAGFLALRSIAGNSVFIHLAAVRERYRAAGVALSLYAHAVQWAKDEGYTAVEGRISSANTNVMNLYAFLGASFANPRDVFLKEV